MTPQEIVLNHKNKLEVLNKVTPSNYAEHTTKNYVLDTLSNAIAIFMAIEKSGYSGIIHESSQGQGKIIINSLGTIESEGELSENAIADYLDWESKVMAHLDAPEVLLKWDVDEKENEDPDFPEKVGFTSVGFNYMKLLPY